MWNTVQPLHNDILYSNILVVAMLLAFPLIHPRAPHVNP
jgi:serine/threonine protein kinase